MVALSWHLLLGLRIEALRCLVNPGRFSRQTSAQTHHKRAYSRGAGVRKTARRSLDPRPNGQRFLVGLVISAFQERRLEVQRWRTAPSQNRSGQARWYPVQVFYSWAERPMTTHKPRVARPLCRRTIEPKERHFQTGRFHTCSRRRPQAPTNGACHRASGLRTPHPT